MLDDMVWLTDSDSKLGKFVRNIWAIVMISVLVVFLIMIFGFLIFN